MRQSDEKQLYVLLNLPWHLRAIRADEQLARVLTHSAFVGPKVRCCGVAALVGDFDLFEGESPYARDRNLLNLREALLLAAPAVSDDPSHLGIQLAGRLDAGESRDLQTLVSDLIDAGSAVVGRPITRSLTEPVGGLRQSIEIGYQIESFLINKEASSFFYVDDVGTLRMIDLLSGSVRAEIGLPGALPIIGLLHTTSAPLICGPKCLIIANLSGSLEETAITWSVGWRVAFGATGQTIVVSAPNALYIWDVRLMRQTYCCELPFVVQAISVSDDGRQVTLSSDKGVFAARLDTPNTSVASAPLPSKGEVVALLTDETGSGVVLLVREKRQTGFRIQDEHIHDKVYVWQPWRSARVRLLDSRAEPLTVWLNDSGDSVFVGDESGTITKFSFLTRAVLDRWRAHATAIWQIRGDRTGRVAVSVDANMEVRRWVRPPLSARSRRPKTERHKQAVSAVIFNSDASMAASADEDVVILWDTRTGMRIHRFRWSTRVGRSAGSALEVAAEFLKLSPLSLNMDRYLSWFVHTPVSAVAFDDVRKLLVAADENTVRAWHVDRGRECWFMRTHHSRKHSSLIEATFADADVISNPVALSVNGRYLGSRVTGDTVCVRDLHKQKPLSDLSCSAMQLAFSAGAGRIALTWYDRIEIADLYTGRYLWSFTMEVQRERDELMGMAFAESGSTVVTAHANGTLRVWTFGQKQPSRELPNIFTQSSDYWTDLVGWCQVFHTAAVAVDGSGRLAAVGDNTQIKVVDLSTGAVLAKHYLDYRIACISCSLDGKAIIAGDQDGGVHIISLATS